VVVYRSSTCEIQIKSVKLIRGNCNKLKYPPFIVSIPFINPHLEDYPAINYCKLV
jgi:hypothetical protein